MAVSCASDNAGVGDRPALNVAKARDALRRLNGGDVGAQRCKGSFCSPERGARSDTQRAAWRDEFFRAFREDMTITIETATVRTVGPAQPAPEPTGGFFWGLAGLVALARRRCR